MKKYKFKIMENEMKNDNKYKNQYYDYATEE